MSNLTPIESRVLALPDNTCRWAARQVFGDNERLMVEALVTTHFENRAGDPKANVQNSDPRRTWDQGCFQLNNYWQRHRIRNRPVFDALENARIAREIVDAEGHWGKWYGPCTKGREKLPVDRCRP